MIKALKNYYAEAKRLPVSGVVPDMVSTTDSFLDLQRIYVAKAEADRAKMREIVNQVCRDRGLPENHVT